MSKDDDFNMALQVLHLLSAGPSGTRPLRPLVFSREHEKELPVLTALKILHNAALEGSDYQKKILYQKKEAISQLNLWLRDPVYFSTLVEKTLGTKVVPSLVEGMQVALPDSFFLRVFKKITQPLFRLLGCIQDLLYIPLAFFFQLIYLFKSTWDPKEGLKGKTPILLLHGMNYNQMVFLFGRYYLRKKGVGPLFSLNYAGHFTNKKEEGIDDYARGRVAEKIREICLSTGSEEVILVGHSMGGLIAGYYAEYVSAAEKIKVRQVVTLGSPWRGSPLIRRFFTTRLKVKRLDQMERKSLFLRALRERALQSEREGLRFYYSLLSQADSLVPGFLGKLSEDPRRQWISSYLGHMTLCFSRCVWAQVFRWIQGSKRV